VQSTAEAPNGPLELRVYPGPDCRGSLYVDDGSTFDYRKGAFLRLAFSCEETPEGVSVKAAPADGSFTPWFSSIAWVVHGARAPKQVTVGGKPTHSYHYDPTKNVVTVTAPYLKEGQVVAIAY
jgi:alpha-glucosidase